VPRPHTPGRLRSSASSLRPLPIEVVRDWLAEGRHHRRARDRIIGAAIRIHRKYGPDLLASVYTLSLAQELPEEGLEVDVWKPLPLTHKDLKIHRAYTLDLLVENRVIVEVKSVSKIADIHIAQLLTYLRLTNIQLGLILNCSVLRMTEGAFTELHRRVR
jgi:GxxExxY protein